MSQAHSSQADIESGPMDLGLSNSFILGPETVQVQSVPSRHP